MNHESRAFSAEPDRVLGGELRAVLDRSGEAEFVAVVMAGADGAGVGSTRAVLGRWTRVAVAALVVAALGSTLAIRTSPPQEPALALDTEWVTAATGSTAAAALFTSERAPDATVLYASDESN